MKTISHQKVPQRRLRRPAPTAKTLLVACTLFVATCSRAPKACQASPAAPSGTVGEVAMSARPLCRPAASGSTIVPSFVHKSGVICQSFCSTSNRRLAEFGRGSGTLPMVERDTRRTCGVSEGTATVTMGSTRSKRSGGRGRLSKPKGVSKKARRILEPPSEAEMAYDQKREKVSMMNWGKLGSGAGRGGRGRGSAASAGLEATWKDTTLPKEGDLLQCKHFKTCPGCEFDRQFDNAPITVDSSSFLDNLHASAARKRGGSAAALDFEPHVIHGWDPHGWRTVAKLAVRPVSKWGGVELGLYKLGSHEVVGIPECRVHHPSVNRAVEVVQASAKKIGVTGFRQDNMDGDLRYIQVIVERASGQVQLSLVWNQETYRDATPKLQIFAKDLRASAPDLFHSIWANFRVGASNVIFSRDPHSWHRCSGPEYLKEIIGPDQVPFFFSPPLFRQANMDHFEHIVRAVVDWVPEGSGVCELYAGVGVLGLNCASKARFVRCSDVNSFNPRSFERSRQSLPRELQRTVSFEALTAEEAIEEGEAEDCEVLIVDPPRKGLDKGVLDALSDPQDEYTSQLRRVIYVSCGFDALKRDTLTLLEAGWSLRHSEGFILFPGSDHVETLVILDR